MKIQKKSMKTLILLLLYLLCSLISFGQVSNAKARGKVIDINGEGLPGVNITVVGSSRGVISDNDGSFELDNVAIGSRLLFRFLGMQEKEFVFQNDEFIHVTLEA